MTSISVRRYTDVCRIITTNSADNAGVCKHVDCMIHWPLLSISGVARNLRQGVRKVVLPLSSLPFPSLPLPLPFPFLYSFTSPFFSLHLEVGPLNTARRSGGALYGLHGAEKQRI